MPDAARLAAALEGRYRVDRVLPFANVSPDADNELDVEMHHIVAMRIVVEAETDEPIWAEKYSGTVDDGFDVQERVFAGHRQRASGPAHLV